MNISEIVKSDTVIKVTRQNIDDKLGIPETCPLPNKCSVTVISGGMGSGKSSFLNSIFTAKGKGKIYANCFDHVHFTSPKETFDSEVDHPFKNHNPARLYFDLNATMLNEIATDALKVKSEGGNSALIIDDWSENLKSRQIELALKRLVHKHRHMKLSIFISLLTLKSLPRSLRALVDSYIIFKPKSQIEIGNFADEVFALSRDALRQLFVFVFDKPYNFLYYDQRLHKFHRNFNLLNFDSD